MKLDWTAGNRIEVLENGEEYYPRVFAAIAAARREVVIETFILFDDPVGRQLHAVLLEVARRGVQVDLTVDGYGSPDLSDEFIRALTDAGVRLHVYDPRPRLLGLRYNLVRRMHRKIVVIDGELAFIGGINFSEDHLIASGPMSKQDYAVQVQGPVVRQMHGFVHEVLAPVRHALLQWVRHGFRRPVKIQPPAPSVLPPVGSAQAVLVTRDNERHTNDIERCYRTAIRTARREVVIANAYFFPGYRLLRELRRAARRGVAVHLILQGEPDMAIVRIGARMLYHSLVKDGVHVHEYCKRPLHGKVAVVDGEWATVGSSNLDPLSLSLNLEANLLIRDRDFAADLRQRLQRLIDNECTEMSREALPKRTMWRYLGSALAFHLLRHFPSWAEVLPRSGKFVRSFIGRRQVDVHPEALHQADR
ncbi:cardiolipin synthase ClsB [Azohydromonas caseinilytica]|uniref:Cardiolipin synthase B n=1 Tax=Azohydromonas caseinilytica TaxID=2728836 RepID=A0A848FA69_9BURK|nr:cardiolipin synthase ClsB [Azohydromonas caseinilytica]NML15349.1 cardiolipin synthase ClsB [Azohydromonas caseinilytica]